MIVTLVACLFHTPVNVKTSIFDTYWLFMVNLCLYIRVTRHCVLVHLRSIIIMQKSGSFNIHRAIKCSVWPLSANLKHVNFWVHYELSVCPLCMLVNWMMPLVCRGIYSMCTVHTLACIIHLLGMFQMCNKIIYLIHTI